jgi:hypothetical protein
MRVILHIWCQIQITHSGLGYVKSGPVKSNKMAFLAIQSSIFNWSYLRCYCWRIDKSMRVTLHTCCETQGTAAVLCYVKSGPGKIQYIYKSCYSVCNIQLTVSPSILLICRQWNARYTPHMLPSTGHKIRFGLCQLWSRKIQYNNSSCHSGFNLQLNVSPLRLVVCRQIDACYTPHLLPNTRHNIRFTLCQLWCRSNTILLLFLIFRLQYLIESISVDIDDMSTIQYTLYSTFAAKHRVHQPVCSSSTLGLG